MKAKVTVKQKFMDKFVNGKIYNVDDVIEGFDAKRIKNLKKLGLVEVEGDLSPEQDDDLSQTPVTEIDMSGHYAAVQKQIKTFEDVDKLVQYLEAEKGLKEPRPWAIAALESRLEELEITE